MPNTQEQALLFLRSHEELSDANAPETVPTTGEELESPEERTRESVASGGTLIFSTEMPSLEELLEQNRVAYTVLERTTFLDAVERRVWMFLFALALVWGALTGLSLAIDDFLLHPATTLFGWLALVVLAGTTRLASGKST